MGTSRYISLLFGILAIAALSSCSRESSLSEDVSLKNNHSRVFARRTAFEDPKAFADSIANTNFSAADSLADTLTVTIDDTVYLMGILPRNAEKVYRFQWNLTKANGKDSVVTARNATPQSWVYSKPGVYYPLFIAIDGNNSTDTAGTDTKRTYIKVIDTKPDLWVPKDTLWTSNKGNITFPILVSDSFGTVEKILVDLDASGKEEAKEWKFETREKSDSLYLTIKNDPKKIDEKGNQKIYVIAIDDDGNETKDSVNLHFNRVPKLKILYPQDGARHNIADRFYFYYEGTDEDNPQNLKYFIYAQVSKNGQPPSKAFDSGDLIAEDFTSTIFEPTNLEGKNVITLVNNPTKELTGRIYWDMYVTDGYDIVYMDRISTGDNTSRPWNFYIGDLKSTQGSISGVARFQGRTNHAGINVEFFNGVNTYSTTTDSKGNYTVKLGAGSYTAIASSNVSEYKPDTLKEIYLESGVVLTADSMELKDTVAPLLRVQNADTLKIRSWKQFVQAIDRGSKVKVLEATFDGKKQQLEKCTYDATSHSCYLNLTDMVDGKHQLAYTATDSAGNKTSIKKDIYVDATILTLNVNGAQKHLIGKDSTLYFVAGIFNALPDADSVSWTWTIKGKAETKKTAVDSNGVAIFKMTYDELAQAGAADGTSYTMLASYKHDATDVSAQVKFGILGNDPAIFFAEPADSTVVTMNDSIHFKVTVLPGKASTTLTASFDCGTNLSAGFSCPEQKVLSAEQTDIETYLAFNKVGTHKVLVHVKDQLGYDSHDTVTVTVISDPPTINASTDSKTNEFKINAKVPVTIDASDKFGTVNQIKWGCTNGNPESPMFSFDYDTVLVKPDSVITGLKLSVQLTSVETNSYTCVFKAIDDDGEEGTTSIKFTTLLDLPTVKLATKSDTVKINSIQTVKANATDKLGYITDYEIACNEDKASLKNPEWEKMDGPTASVRMPEKATKYYCVVRVTDDDNNHALDTATYWVIVGRPTVTAVLPPAFETVTIKDTIEVNAIAQDSLGSIVKYEWGCGASNAGNIGFNVSSDKTPLAKLVMPSAPQDKYLCVIRVTDDDNNTARDTVEIKVLLAPPTIEVTNKNLVVREKFNIALNATAEDNNNVPSDPGAIVKREWSCGIPNDIEKNWKTVSAFDTVWKAPDVAPVSYYCVARATDNDGNAVTDTTFIKFSTETPVIQVKDNLIYVNVGDAFELSATINDVWQGVDWFSWECVNKETGKSLEKDGKAPKYDYKKNGGHMTIGRDSTYSAKGVDMYCIVSAQETSTKAIFSDSTEVRIMKQHPEGVISAADTVYLWSGDENVDDDAIIFYTKEWGGMKSKIGELGNNKTKDFYWSFTGENGTFYQGLSDGNLDTSKAEFYSAFTRMTSEGSRTITLDFRDSITATPSYAFFSRHRAALTTRTIYFRKAWENLAPAKDTVLESTGMMGTAPALAMMGDYPVEAYLKTKTSVGVKIYRKGSWTAIDASNAKMTDSIVSIELASSGSDIYLGLLDQNNNFSIFKSAGASSPFAKMGDVIKNVINPKLIYNPKAEALALIALNSTDKQAYLYRYNSGWTSTKIATKDATTWRELDAVVNENGTTVVITVDNSSTYKAYFSMFDYNYKSLCAITPIAEYVNKVSLAISGSTIYMGFANRDYTNYGPHVYKGTLSSNNISWKKDGVFNTPIYEGAIAYHMSVAVSNGIVYVAMDDNNKPDYSQINVFRLENNKWRFHGENQLPYFTAPFKEAKEYYLRGWNPKLAVDGAGKVHLSMLAREQSHGTSTKNNGPLVMKYVADNWEIHE